LETEREAELREQVASIAARLFKESDQEFDGTDHALFVVLMAAMREYLSDYPGTEDGRWTRRDLWAALQSAHELLEEEAVDFPDEGETRSASLPDRPTLAVVRNLMQLSHVKSTYSTGGAMTIGDLFAMVKSGLLKDGMLFYDVARNKKQVCIVRVNVRGDQVSRPQSIHWSHVSDDGTVLQGPFASPSKCSFAIRGNTHNPYDNWRTEGGETLRQLFMRHKASQ
jgi:hypothetical protein